MKSKIRRFTLLMFAMALVPAGISTAQPASVGSTPLQSGSYAKPADQFLPNDEVRHVHPPSVQNEFTSEFTSDFAAFLTADYGQDRFAISQYNIENAGNTPSQWGALLRSFVMPGWGHYYVDSDRWRRGQLHLGAEVVLLASYLGINRQSYVLEKNMYTHAAAFSGAQIRDLGREFELAVGGHRSLADYNDFQERTRNLDRIFPDEPQYRWEWESDELRREYLDLRNRRDDLDQQLPALVALMVANRVISGVSAFARAGAYGGDGATVSLAPGPALQGIQAVVTIPLR